jgi:hypothetical protein
MKPGLLDLVCSWRRVVNFGCFTPKLKGPRYPLDRRLGGPKNQTGRNGEENILDLKGIRTTTLQSSSPYIAVIPTSPPQSTNFQLVQRLRKRGFIHSPIPLHGIVLVS